MNSDFCEVGIEKIFYLNNTKLNNTMSLYYNNIIKEVGFEIVVLHQYDNKNI